MKNLVFVALVLVSIAGCAAATPTPRAPEKCPAQGLTISILSSRSINRAPEGEPRPVVVRLYALKSDTRLSNASFEKVWKDDKATLGEDVVSVQEIEVYPGARIDMKLERAPAVNHVAAVALFANPTGKAWSASLDLPPVPEPGKCGASCASDDDECLASSAATAHLVYYVDGSKIDDGVEHLEEYPAVGKLKSGK